MEKETRCFAIRCWVEHRLEVLKYAFEAHEEDMSRNKEWFKHAYGWLVEEFCKRCLLTRTWKLGLTFFSILAYEEVVFLANILDNIERNQICAKLGGERLPRDFRPRSIKPIGSGRPRKQTNLYPIV